MATIDSAAQLSLDDYPPPGLLAREQLKANFFLDKCWHCGHEKRIWRRTLRPCFITAMRVIAERGPMSTAELFAHFSENARLASAIKSHFAETTLWDFTEHGSDGRWKLTNKAGAFLRGEIQVFRKVWPRDQELPPGCEDEELVYADEVTGEKPDLDDETKSIPNTPHAT